MIMRIAWARAAAAAAMLASASWPVPSSSADVQNIGKAPCGPPFCGTAAPVAVPAPTPPPAARAAPADAPGLEDFADFVIPEPPQRNRTQAAPARQQTARMMQVDIGLGRSRIIQLPRVAREAFVANPKVADAQVKTSKSLYISGLADGSTSVIVSDENGTLIAQIEVRVTRDDSALIEALQAAIPHANLSVRAAGETIILSGSVNSTAEAMQAVEIASGFVGADTKKVINAMTIKAREQVMLKVTVAEIQRKVLKQLGIAATGNWQVGDMAIKAVLDAPLGVAGRSLTGSGIGLSGSDGDVTLKAMEDIGVARTLAEPSATVISGETTTSLVGGQIPIPTGSTCTNANSCQPTIEFKNYGVTLTFTPIVMTAGRISLKVGTEVSEVDPTNRLTIPNGNSSLAIPAFKVRKQETTVELPSGGALVTAGLIQQDSRQAMDGLPGIMNIPVFGALARSRDYQRDETELVIIVTPYIVKPIEPRRAVRPDKGWADAPDPKAVFMGQVNRVVGKEKTGTPPASAPFKGHTGFILE